MRITMRALVLMAVPLVPFVLLMRVQPPEHQPFAVDHDWNALYWLWAGSVYFAGALTFVVLVRALAGMWSRPELPLLPSRDTVAVLALGSLLAAVPQGIDAGVQLLTLP